MGKIIKKHVVKPKKGHMYYLDGKGNVCETKMKRGGSPKRKRSK